MPLTSMYKLSRMDPIDANPAQIKVAVRADEAIGIGKGDAQIEFKFDAERMKQLQLEMAPFRKGDVKGSGSFRVNLSGMCLHNKMQPGEVQVDVFLQTSEQEGRNMDELPDCGG